MSFLSHEEQKRLIELDLASTREIVLGICEVLVAESAEPYEVRIYALAQAVASRMSPENLPVFAAVAIEMLSQRRASDDS